MSFFKKYTPPGSTPIAPQKRIIRTNHHSHTSSSEPRSSAKLNGNASAAGSGISSADKKAPRRVASANTVLPHATSPPNKLANASARKENGSGSPLKRKLDPVRSTPNLKRPASGDNPRESVRKPPTPESVSSSRSPKPMRLESSDDESEDERETKRSKVGSRSPMSQDRDPARKLVHPISFRTKDPKTGEPVPKCEFIHAEQIANVTLKDWSRRKEFRKAEPPLNQVGLHYPGIPDQEVFQLVQHSDPDELDPIAEMFTTMERVAEHLLPPALADQVHSETSGGIVYSLKRALKHGDTVKFLTHLKAYNSLVRQCRKDGTFRRILSSMHTPPFTLTEHILQQSYARTVALQVEGLKEYQAFSSEVYGELLPKFTTKIFKEAGLTSNQVFVDLGSGTGNVVLHAALETGAESWGCEKMSKPAQLAALQRDEFIARCRMWGISHGPVHLEHDTFLENRNIAEVLKRADVLLVNNFAFEPDLNQKLLDMFLDLKEGAMIFSLKPFVPANHVITKRNAESPVNRLRMVEREYFSREVSWTDSGGKYYVHTVDGSMIREFMEREGREAAARR